MLVIILSLTCSWMSGYLIQWQSQDIYKFLVVQKKKKEVFKITHMGEKNNNNNVELCGTLYLMCGSNVRSVQTRTKNQTFFCSLHKFSTSYSVTSSVEESLCWLPTDCTFSRRFEFPLAEGIKQLLSICLMKNIITKLVIDQPLLLEKDPCQHLERWADRRASGIFIPKR